MLHLPSEPVKTKTARHLGSVQAHFSILNSRFCQHTQLGLSLTFLSAREAGMTSRSSQADIWGFPASRPCPLLWMQPLGRQVFTLQFTKYLLPGLLEPHSSRVSRGLESLEIPLVVSQPWIYVSSHCLADVMPRKDHGNCGCRKITLPGFR